MHFLVIAAGLVAAAAASPLAIEPRQGAKCPDWGKGFGGSVLLGPTDAEASRCCVYGESLAHCCRNKPFADDPYWSRALECSSPYWQTSSAHGPFYVCQIEPCRPGCDSIPYLFTNKPECPK